MGELAKGVRLLPPGERRERLRIWLDEELPERFGNRMLPVDQDTAQRWGKLMADTHRTLPAIDGLLAAIALHHDLRLVTRNVADFSHLGLEVINPWTWD